MSDSDSSAAKCNIKKHKKRDKKHKKDKKRHKHRKRSRPHSDEGSYDNPSKVASTPPNIESKPICGPVISTVISSQEVLQNDLQQDGAFGPALPPHLLAKQEQPKHLVAQQEKPPAIIGPVLPSNLMKPADVDIDLEKDDANNAMFGPLPITTTEDISLKTMTVAQIELEERALEMKLAKFGSDTNGNVDQKEREEWMLELPDVGLKPGLASIKRTFHTGKERPDFSDRSSWTKTPQNETNAKASSSKSKDTLKADAEAMYENQRDYEQERIAKRLKKEHKREASLVELHQKKLRKEQRKKEKELAESGAKAERRPFSREVDLKLNKIDKNQTKFIVDKAKILNTKFSSGKAKYL